MKMKHMKTRSHRVLGEVEVELEAYTQELLLYKEVEAIVEFDAWCRDHYKFFAPPDQDQANKLKGSMPKEPALKAGRELASYLPTPTPTPPPTPPPAPALRPFERQLSSAFPPAAPSAPEGSSPAPPDPPLAAPSGMMMMMMMAAASQGAGPGPTAGGRLYPPSPPRQAAPASPAPSEPAQPAGEVVVTLPAAPPLPLTGPRYLRVSARIRAASSAPAPLPPAPPPDSSEGPPRAPPGATPAPDPAPPPEGAVSAPETAREAGAAEDWPGPGPGPGPSTARSSGPGNARVAGPAPHLSGYRDAVPGAHAARDKPGLPGSALAPSSQRQPGSPGSPVPRLQVERAGPGGEARVPPPARPAPPRAAPHRLHAHEARRQSLLPPKAPPAEEPHTPPRGRPAESPGDITARRAPPAGELPALRGRAGEGEEARPYTSPAAAAGPRRAPSAYRRFEVAEARAAAEAKGRPAKLQLLVGPAGPACPSGLFYWPGRELELQEEAAPSRPATVGVSGIGGLERERDRRRQHRKPAPPPQPSPQEAAPQVPAEPSPRELAAEPPPREPRGTPRGVRGVLYGHVSSSPSRSRSRSPPRAGKLSKEELQRMHAEAQQEEKAAAKAAATQHRAYVEEQLQLQMPRLPARDGSRRPRMSPPRMPEPGPPSALDPRHHLWHTHRARSPPREPLPPHRAKSQPQPPPHRTKSPPQSPRSPGSPRSHPSRQRAGGSPRAQERARARALRRKKHSKGPAGPKHRSWVRQSWVRGGTVAQVLGMKLSPREKVHIEPLPEEPEGTVPARPAVSYKKFMTRQPPPEEEGGPRNVAQVVDMERQPEKRTAPSLEPEAASKGISHKKFVTRQVVAPEHVPQASAVLEAPHL